MSRLPTPSSHATRAVLNDPNVRADALFAVLVGVVTIVEASSPDRRSGGTGADAFAFVTIVIASASLLFRRHRPLTVLAIVATVLGVFYVRNGGEFLSLLGLSAFYAAAAHSTQRTRLWVAVSVAGTTLFGIAWVSIIDTPDGYDVDGAASMAAFLIGITAIGAIVRNRQQVFADSEDRAVAAEADRRAGAARAVAQERSRIAREMHDVVAHGMSVIAVQAAAAREVVHTDPDKAEEVLGRIENVGRQSLNEMRRMLDVLRTNDDESGPSFGPQPGLVDIQAAVTQSVDAGVATELAVTGDVRELPPGVELTGFRIVQEALTNVLKHAGPSASATVAVEYGLDEVAIEVVDDGRGVATALSDTGGGNGVIGMRERVEIYRGELSAGPRVGGGYAVKAVLPTDEVAARPTVGSSMSSVADRGV